MVSTKPRLWFGSIEKEIGDELKNNDGLTRDIDAALIAQASRLSIRTEHSEVSRGGY
jgi:hypothetical protein